VLVCIESQVPTVTAARTRLPRLAHVVTTGVQDWLRVRDRLLAPLVGRRGGWYRRVRPDDDVWSMTGLVAHAGGLAKQVPVAPDTPAVVLRTGGTTGRRRGVVLTHGNLVSNAFQARLWVPDVQAGRETLLCGLPLWHAYGLTMGMLVAVLAGARLVLVARPDVDEVLDAIDRTRPTLLPGVPRLFAALVDHPDIAEHDLSSVRACVSGGAPLPPEVHRAFEEVTGGARLREGYGLTETSPLTHANPIYGRTTPGAIGLPVTDTVAAVVDPEDPSRLCAHGEVGMLVVHGPQVMAGYWRDPEATAEVLVDGWLVTGDLATCDADGVFRVVERAGEVLTVGGVRVVPSEVESALLTHPGVLEAAVVGLPAAGAAPDDPVERLKAFVVLRARSRATAGELTEHCRQRLDEPTTVPDEVAVVDELPRSVLGKVLRRELERTELARLAAAPLDGPGGTA
jgi:long-chain acyl-CoA synthetase